MIVKKRTISKNEINTMRKIRILSKTIDLQISHLLTADQCEEFYEKVKDKELLKSIRIGGYCKDESLQMMFLKYSIR